MLLGIDGAQAQSQEEVRRVFEEILRDPTNTDLNFRYARLARERGELRKELAAYERILAADPDNEEAQAGIRRVRRLLEPERTEVVVLVGGQYQSNTQHEVNSGADTDDFILVGRATLTDQRVIGGQRWRTNGDAFSNWHDEFGETDFINVGLRTGPVFALTDDWDVHPAIGGAYAWLDSEKFFVEGSVYLSFEATDGGAFQSFNLRGSFNEIGGEISGRDAYVLEVNPRFVVSDLVTKRDSMIVNPSYRYNGVIGSGGTGTGPQGETFPLRYHQVGARADYYYPLTDEIYSGVNVTVDYQLYDEPVFGQSNDRRDLYLAPGAQIIVSRVLLGNLDVVFSYQYERNLSNDDLEDFQNHIAGVQSVWRF